LPDNNIQHCILLQACEGDLRDGKQSVVKRDGVACGMLLAHHITKSVKTAVMVLQLPSHQKRHKWREGTVKRGHPVGVGIPLYVHCTLV